MDGITNYTNEKITNRQRMHAQRSFKSRKTVTTRKRTKEEILKQIEWADELSLDSSIVGGKNLPEHRRAICEGCGTLFDNAWRADKQITDKCAMCS